MKQALFAVGPLIFKVAVCTLLLLLGLRLMLLSQEAFVSFLSRILGIHDLETSPSTVIVIRIVGALLVLTSLALVYVFFIPKPVETSALLQQAAVYAAHA